MNYTPALTTDNVCTLRRIAWAGKIPMTKALNEIVERFVQKLDSSMICKLCRDTTRCSNCGFHNSKQAT